MAATFENYRLHRLLQSNVDALGDLNYLPWRDHADLWFTSAAFDARSPLRCFLTA
jgi:hypothetical protein